MTWQAGALADENRRGGRGSAPCSSRYIKMTTFPLRRRDRVMNLFWKAVLTLAATCCFTGCETVSDMVTTNLPKSQRGRASIVVSLRQQRAYLYRGRELVS